MSQSWFWMKGEVIVANYFLCFQSPHSGFTLFPSTQVIHYYSNINVSYLMLRSNYRLLSEYLVDCFYLDQIVRSNFNQVISFALDGVFLFNTFNLI